MHNFLGSFDFNKPLSLYIHVPFCDSKCSYCAFFSVVGYDYDVKKKYVNRLLEELETVVSLMNGRPFETAYVGGGNPGCLDSCDLEKIASLVCCNGSPKEFTVEMNPDSLKPNMDCLFDGLFSRLSLGVQSLDAKALSFLGRNATLDESFHGLEISQEISTKTGCELSYDLITCLGLWHDPMRDVKTIVRDFPSNHLSVYALTLEEGTPLYKRKPTLPTDDAQASILENVWAFLESEGFEHYEVSNFAKSSKRGLHNCCYWGYKPYIGLGPGAASTAFNNGKICRCETGKSVYKYIMGHCFDNVSCMQLSSSEALEEFVLMGLRYKGALDLDRLRGDFGVNVDSSMLNLLSSLDGYFIDNSGENLKLVPLDEGLLTADYAALRVLEILESNSRLS